MTLSACAGGMAALQQASSMWDASQEAQESEDERGEMEADEEQERDAGLLG